jgi:hypothetical protein
MRSMHGSMPSNQSEGVAMASSTRAQKAAPAEIERAVYVAWMLRVDPSSIFPFEPESTAEANQHLVDFVCAELDRLTNRSRRVRDSSAKALWFRLTLDHCNDVMAGRADPSDNDWLANKAGFHRGIYVSQGPQK